MQSRHQDPAFLPKVRSQLSIRQHLVILGKWQFGGKQATSVLPVHIKQPALFVLSSLLQTVKNSHRVFGFKQIFRHGKPHVPEADKPDFGGRWAINFESLYIHNQPASTNISLDEENKNTIHRISFAHLSYLRDGKNLSEPAKPHALQVPWP